MDNIANIPMNTVKCEEVIISTLLRRGEGKPGDPIRVITQVFTKDGELIAERDPYLERETVRIP